MLDLVFSLARETKIPYAFDFVQHIRHTWIYMYVAPSMLGDLSSCCSLITFRGGDSQGGNFFLIFITFNFHLAILKYFHYAHRLYYS